jgi:hypothetical protein
MKLSAPPQPKTFEPVTITIESEAELNFFRDVIGYTSTGIMKTYGAASLDTVYNALDNIFPERGLAKSPQYKVTFSKL